jgi:hypothetical protein
MTKRAGPLVFTSQTGESFELKLEDVPAGCPLSSKYISTRSTDKDEQSFHLHERVDGTVKLSSASFSLRPKPSHRRKISCGSSSPLIAVVNVEDLPDKIFVVEPLDLSPSRNPPPSPGSVEKVKSGTYIAVASMVYNEYGELVDAQSLLNPPTPSELNVTQILRVIKKAYYHDVRNFRPPVSFHFLFRIRIQIDCSQIHGFLFLAWHDLCCEHTVLFNRNRIIPSVHTC